MTLADPAIIGIVALLVMCIPGVRWFSRIVRRKLRSRRNQPSNRNTVLPLSDRSSPLFGPPDSTCIDPYVVLPTPIGTTRQATHVWMPSCPIIVAASMSVAVIWPAVDLPPRRSGRPLSRITDHRP
ncbi:hypothetical protein F4801DRAFT_555826, partial [Xylaria longipes]